MHTDGGKKLQYQRRRNYFTLNHIHKDEDDGEEEVEIQQNKNTTLKIPYSKTAKKARRWGQSIYIEDYH